MSKKQGKGYLSIVDKNFLEYNVFVIDDSRWDTVKVEKITINEEEHDRIVRCKEFDDGTRISVATVGYSPNSTDILILFALLGLTQLKGNPLVTSIYEILNFLGWSHAGKNYEKVRKSIFMWRRSDVYFHKNFYFQDKREKGSIEFSIISSVAEIGEGKRFQISFDPGFLNIMKDNRFYSLLDMKEFGSLKTDMSRRLLFLLIKSFYSSETFAIRWEKMREKLESRAKNKSKLVEVVSKAVNQINSKTSLKISFEPYGDNLVFRLKDEEKRHLTKFLEFLIDNTARHNLSKEDIAKLSRSSKLKKKKSESGDYYLWLIKDTELLKKVRKDSEIFKMCYEFQISIPKAS